MSGQPLQQQYNDSTCFRLHSDCSTSITSSHLSALLFSSSALRPRSTLVRELSYIVYHTRRLPLCLYLGPESCSTANSMDCKRVGGRRSYADVLKSAQDPSVAPWTRPKQLCRASQSSATSTPVQRRQRPFTN
jgi:hypothetical protein